MENGVRSFSKKNMVTELQRQMLVTYQTHYNKKVEQIFSYTHFTHYPKNKKTEVLHMKQLVDFNENKEYGAFSKFSKKTYPFGCRFLDKSCESEREWDLLVKPYMEE